MTKMLLSFLTSLVVISTASAQNGEYFTALKGVSAARELITCPVGCNRTLTLTAETYALKEAISRRNDS
jgi:hypothetical protein